jgi:uroporphyrin-III C-methyltransferase
MHRKEGKVIFIGAGPGDPELLTIKALRYLQQADVVLADRLVSPEILSNYIAPSTEIIAVGNQCRKGASTPQETINALMVLHAKQGKLVVRLKGGDVSIFSNILDELKELQAHQVSYEIIPGITAALGAAAYAGIPLTARGYATAVRFLTYYKSEIISADYWKELAQTDDTLVFYMSAETLPEVVQQLTSNGVAKDKLLAVVEQATTVFQRVTLSGLYDFVLPDTLPASPSLIIVGKVVALHEQFAWLQPGVAADGYFPPVAARLLDYEKEENNRLTA